ncbi:universal stress protein [Azoarcus taiwanensis]|uniref:Universal stress protein n=1 Tax=Azoarcus taiwanensis TaxID=666964 RepID=A0A972FF37_9RHOO|nr:universal stress protein [Azoarcus taiwanensis]NMG04413.1 universal stress protein [Azoarcus taiwanensis]
MFGHIVVAVDFSPAWETIARVLPSLRDWGCKRLTLVHVLAARYGQVPPETHREQYDARLNGYRDSLSQAGFSVGTVVEAGEPARTLADVAERAGADVILAGSHGHSAIRELFLGSTVLNLARLTRIPMLLWPTNAVLPPIGGLRTVVLGTDCSQAAAAAENRFVALVAAGAKGVAVCAIERGELAEREREQSCARDHIQKLTNRCRGEVSFRMEAGLAAQVILRIAHDARADLLIVGKRGHNRLHELLLGSTAEAVCRGSALPVLLVPT